MKTKMADCRIMEILKRFNEKRALEGKPEVRFIDLYRHVGVSKQAASLWVHVDVCKRSFPSRENRKKIAQFLTVPVNQIWVNRRRRMKKSLDRSKQSA